MTIRQYFENKINWKIFNSILDKCTEFEDKNITYILNVCVKKQASPSIEPFYDTIYTRFYVNDSNIRIHYDDEEFKLDDYIKLYERDGLYYMVSVGGKNTKNIDLKNRFLNNKKLDFITEFEEDGVISIVLKEKHENI